MTLRPGTKGLSSVSETQTRAHGHPCDVSICGSRGSRHLPSYGLCQHKRAPTPYTPPHFRAALEHVVPQCKHDLRGWNSYVTDIGQHPSSARGIAPRHICQLFRNCRSYPPIPPGPLLPALLFRLCLCSCLGSRVVGLGNNEVSQSPSPSQLLFAPRFTMASSSLKSLLIVTARPLWRSLCPTIDAVLRNYLKPHSMIPLAHLLPFVLSSINLSNAMSRSPVTEVSCFEFVEKPALPALGRVRTRYTPNPFGSP
jgi:hypothetical protein